MLSAPLSLGGKVEVVEVVPISLFNRSRRRVSPASDFFSVTSPSGLGKLTMRQTELPQSLSCPHAVLRRPQA